MTLIHIYVLSNIAVCTLIKEGNNLKRMSYLVSRVMSLWKMFLRSNIRTLAISPPLIQEPQVTPPTSVL